MSNIISVYKDSILMNHKFSWTKNKELKAFLIKYFLHKQFILEMYYFPGPISYTGTYNFESLSYNLSEKYFCFSGYCYDDNKYKTAAFIFYVNDSSEKGFKFTYNSFGTHFIYNSDEDQIFHFYRVP